MAGGRGKIRPEDGKQFSSEYQPDKEVWTEELSLLFLEDLIKWIKAEDENIFVDDFIFLSCDESKYEGKIYATLPNYLASKFTSCSNLYAKAIEMQKTKLIKYGVFDTLNAQMTKFVLINNHGFKDKTDVTTEIKTTFDPKKYTAEELLFLAEMQNKPNGDS
jgi:hypothetical protein